MNWRKALLLPNAPVRLKLEFPFYPNSQTKGIYLYCPKVNPNDLAWESGSPPPIPSLMFITSSRSGD
jgi:hypothetical protein